jgi:hypothetical protein
MESGLRFSSDSRGRIIWVADAHRDDGKRFVVHADEKLTAFIELESAICNADKEIVVLGIVNRKAVITITDSDMGDANTTGPDAPALIEALSIRLQIDNLERRLSSILGGAPARPAAPTEAGRYFSPSARAKLSAAARARWARLKGGTKPATTTKKGALTPAGRRKLSQLMKARWAARRKAAGTKTAPTAKKGGLTPAGRRRLSQLMKARWAARRRSRAETRR